MRTPVNDLHLEKAHRQEDTQHHQPPPQQKQHQINP